MIKPKHKKIKLKGKYRILVISDIHSHLDRFQQLLAKVSYCSDDYLIILGDFVEKGTQGIELIHFIQTLQSKSNRVFVLLGNCEYALEELITNPEYALAMYRYYRNIGKSGLITQAIDRCNLDVNSIDPKELQRCIRTYLSSELTYLNNLLTTLEFNQFIFVHAGIEHRDDWQNSRLTALIEMKDFYQRGHCLDKYVVVGHLPTSNQRNNLDNSIIVDEKKQIISIDGGTGVKSISQLNCLIIHGYDDEFSLEYAFVRPLPWCQATVSVQPLKRKYHKIAWPNFGVKLINKGKFFSECLQLDTGNFLRIKNEFLYSKGEHLYCLDDYVDHFVSLEVGEWVQVVGIYGIYAYVIKENEVGWVKRCYLSEDNLLNYCGI